MQRCSRISTGSSYRWDSMNQCCEKVNIEGKRVKFDVCDEIWQMTHCYIHLLQYLYADYENENRFVTFEVLTAVLLQTQDLRYVALCLSAFPDVSKEYSASIFREPLRWRHYDATTRLTTASHQRILESLKTEFPVTRSCEWHTLYSVVACCLLPALLYSLGVVLACWWFCSVSN
jgi:hypothetical protein